MQSRFRQVLADFKGAGSITLVITATSALPDKGY